MQSVIAEGQQYSTSLIMDTLDNPNGRVLISYTGIHQVMCLMCNCETKISGTSAAIQPEIDSVPQENTTRVHTIISFALVWSVDCMVSLLTHLICCFQEKAMRSTAPLNGREMLSYVEAPS